MSNNLHHNDNELNRILKALEKTCGDCINREDLLKKCVCVPIAPLIKGDSVHCEYVVFARDIINAESIQQESKTGWIPVSERLPEEEINVLVCNINGDIEISSGSYSTEAQDYFIWCTSGWRFGKVIAWQPLPKPYKKSEVR